MNWITKTCVLLMLIGGINWGLIGLFDFDVVGFLFGAMSLLTRTIYTLVGLATLWVIIDYFYTPKMKIE